MRKFILLVAVILLSNQSLFSQVPSYVPSNGLVGFWPFSGNANDVSGNGNNGTVNGASLTTDRNGFANSAYNFSGGSNISIPMTSALHNLPNRTFSCWYFANGSQSGGRIFETTYPKGGIAIYNGNTLDAWYNNGTNECNVTNINSGTLNQWHNMVYVTNSVGLGTIYIDGILINSRNGVLQTASTNWLSNFLRFGIGAQGESFNGKIDDVGIWNRALTAQEISSIYYQTTSTTCLPDYVPTNGLVGYWPFCGNANDASTNGNNGTVNGATLAADRNGTANSAYSFLNGSQFITLPPPPVNTFTNTMSYSLWYKEIPNTNFVNIFNTTGNKALVLQPNAAGIRANDGNSFGLDGYSSALSINSWKHICVVYVGQVISIYINGVLTNSGTTGFPNTILYNSTQSVLGSTYLMAGQYPFSGLIDDIGIWNRALTPQEISNLYTSCTPPAAPTGALTQTFCATPAPTIASLTASGTGIQWYAAATGGTALATTTALVNGTTYYASQTVSACESTARLAVTVTLSDPQITASATTICNGTQVTLTATSGVTSNFYVGSIGPSGGYVFYDQGSVINGWRYLEAAPSDNGINDGIGCYCSAIPNTSTLIGTGKTNTLNWINSGCNGAWLTTSSSIQINGNNNWFIPSKDEVNLMYTNLKLNNLGNFQNVQYWSSSPASYGSCGINGGVWVQNFTNGNFVSEARNGYGGAGNLRLVRQFSTGTPFATYLWSTGATTATINPTPTATTTYWCDVTVNGVTCRKSVTITVNSTPTPTGAASQTFCATPVPTVASLTVTGTGIQWYAAANGGTALATTTALVNGTTYYASQTLNACESTTRLAVTVILNDPQITASATTVCSGTPVSLSASTNATLAQNGNLPINLQNGLGGYWPFNNNANDASGNSNVGTVFGATLTSDRFGNANSAYNFNGTSDYISIEDNNTLDITNNFTLSGWYFTNNPTQLEQAILGKGRVANGSGYNMLLNSYLSGSNYMFSLGLNNGTSNVGANIPISQSNLTGWHQLIATYDSVNIKLYLDGVLQITTPASISLLNSAQKLFIGRELINFPRYFNGKLDDIAIYNRVLSQAEVTQLYTAAPTYLWSTGATTATINPTPTTTTTYWCDVTVNGVTCRKSVTITVNSTPTPTGAASQTFCATPVPTVASLTSTGTGIQWYAAASGGTALATTTALVNGTTYYASQTLNACESTTRLAVTVILNDPQITASATTVCSGTPVTLSASTTATAVQNGNLPINLQTGLVGYWPFNGNANDVSGNANNGTVQNGTLLSNNRFNIVDTAYDFDGVNDQIEVNNNSSISPSQLLSINLWLFPRAYEDNKHCVSKGSHVNLSNRSYGIQGLENNQKARFFISNGTNEQGISTQTSIPLNQWTLITGVYDGATIKIYVNGSLDNQISFSGSINNTSEPLIFGSHKYYSPSDYWFNGKLDDIAIYNRVLSPTEVIQLYTAAPTYLWSTGETTATINPTPTSTTTYWCDVTVNGVTCRKTMTITVNPNITPTFTQVAAICNGATLAALPTTSTNSITGTWSPALNNTATTTYTFTPTAGLCATTATMTITVNPNITPAFTQVAAICNGATLAALPTTSTNSITGTWSPALNNTATTTYTFTPTAGQCATTATMTITVNSTPTPTGTATQTFCASPVPTVASLTATGTGIQWYATANGGTALATTTALVNATTYYASQTLNACESTTRLAVTVILNDPQITASATTVCSGTPVNLTASTTATVAQNCNLPANLQTGLVGYWPFCGNANDVSGNANNGTVNGATLTTDRFGNANSAYSFDGVDDRIFAGNINLIQDFTFSFWSFVSSDVFQYPIGLGVTNSDGYGIGYSSSNPPCSGPLKRFFVYDAFLPGCSNVQYSQNSVNPLLWKNIVLVKNNNTIKLYINEILEFSSSNLSLQGVLSLYFGVRSDLLFYFNGKLDDIAIYNRALSQSEITQLYNSNQATYLWSTGAITASINPSPTATTTYWCDVTVNGVTCRKTMTITVNPIINPTFTQVAAICNGATLAALPTTSTNNISGTWSPAINNTATTTYTFTPTAGQCATTATITITVNPNITPAFTQVAAICNGATLAALPTNSTNNISGTWSPALNNTATTTYTFTPTAGQCATTATMTITVNPNIAPTFTQVAPICNGATLAALPTTSTNSITGTWSPALNNTATTTYTFTPTAGQCATTATMTITVNPNITPAFSQVPAICNGATLAALPTTSFNNITGTWSPALNNTATTTYTFTPTVGLCATTATMTITVNPIITPTFTQVAAICSGADLLPLPTSSTNGINGTWSPAMNNTATTTYTFTPIARQCATTATMTITVNPNITPTFTQVAAICAGATLAALPTTSNNGYTGTWSPAMNNTATTTYTFTPTAGLCATTATMTITVNPLPLPPTGTITQTFCANIYPTLQNIVVTPANVNWFSSLTSSTPLPITTNLPVGSTTYYASQFDAVTGCSSNGRLAVLATVLLENTPSTLTDQTFCSTDLKTLADIKTNGLNIVWYSSASGGTPLLGSYVLTSSQSLYAAIYNATTGCESPIRQMVQITIINCQLVANNLLTLNDNSLNDNLKIENIENFPINQIEIYNRFGEIVWKTEYYNNDSNTFKGRANVSGVYQKDSDLPTGTYYFLLKYYDSYRGKYTDLKSFLYINNNN